MRRLLTLLFCLLPALAFGDANPHVRLTTSEGDILIELNAEKAPISTENFLSYVNKGHYDGTTFHRVISNFMIQGGGFALENGGLVQKPMDPPIHNEGQNGLKNKRGTIAMARTNELHSATSQFFINVVDNANLDYPNHGGYAVFGKVVEGMDVVDKIRNVRTGRVPLTNRLPNGQLMTRPTSDVPLQPVLIESAKVVEAPKPAEPEGRLAPKEAPIASSEEMLETQKWKPFGVGILGWIPIVLAFLIGSIPFGLLIAKSQGVNIREHGSGNIGATNVWRTLGRRFGIPCLILDALKGLIPVVIVINMFPIDGRSVQLALPLPESWIFTVSASQATGAQSLHILTALFAVLGHNYSPFVGFKGGKGIATSAGVLIGLMPVGVLILIVIFVILLFTTRYVSVASVGTSCVLPLLVLYGSWHHGRLQDGTWNKPLFIFALIIAAMAAWKHRSNFKRLIEGTEARFKSKPKTDHE